MAKVKGQKAALEELGMSEQEVAATMRSTQQQMRQTVHNIANDMGRLQEAVVENEKLAEETHDIIDDAFGPVDVIQEVQDVKKDFHGRADEIGENNKSTGEKEIPDIQEWLKEIQQMLNNNPQNNLTMEAMQMVAELREKVEALEAKKSYVDQMIDNIKEGLNGIKQSALRFKEKVVGISKDAIETSKATIVKAAKTAQMELNQTMSNYYSKSAAIERIQVNHHEKILNEAKAELSAELQVAKAKAILREARIQKLSLKAKKVLFFIPKREPKTDEQVLSTSKSYKKKVDELEKMYGPEISFREKKLEKHQTKEQQYSDKQATHHSKATEIRKQVENKQKVSPQYTQAKAAEKVATQVKEVAKATVKETVRTAADDMTH